MRLFMFMLMLIGVAFGQNPAPRTTPEGALNCRAWNSFTSEMKLGFVLGYIDSWQWARRVAVAKPEFPQMDLASYIPKGASNGEIVTGVSDICDLAANRSFAITEAMGLFAFQLQGATEEQVRLATETYRKIHAEPPPKVAPQKTEK